MYVYHRFYQAKKVALVYPSEKQAIQKGNYYNSIITGEMSDKECSIVHIATASDTKVWQEVIVNQMREFLV